MVLQTDNGPQYSSAEFKEFKMKWTFDHETSESKYVYVKKTNALLLKCTKRIDSTFT